VTTEKKLTQFS